MPAAALALTAQLPSAPTPPEPASAAPVVPLPKKRGPNTPEGKASSRQNALKHGLRAKLLPLLLAGDDAAHFAELLAGLRRTYRPEDAAEAQLVEAIAVATRQEIKADRLEAEALAAMAGGDGRPVHGRMLLGASANRATLHTVLRYQSTASCAVGRAMRLFFQHRRAKRDGLLVLEEESAGANRTNDFPRPDLTAAGPLPMPFCLLPRVDAPLPGHVVPTNRTNELAPYATAPEPRHLGVPPLPLAPSPRAANGGGAMPLRQVGLCPDPG
jgi:hypothetical protein